MKKICLFPLALMACMFILFSCSSTKNATSGKIPTYALLDSQRFLFRVQQVLPQSGRYQRILNNNNFYNYDLRISRDSVIAYLPYFGQAYSAPSNPSEGGIRFVSTKFSYVSKPNKKNRSITIKPQDLSNLNTVQDVQQLSLTVSANGYSTLQIISLNRQPISYYGTIEEWK